MKTFSDFGIQLSSGATGNARTTCPQCSAQRKKPHVKCLSVDVSEGIWLCHHCAWAGSLKDGAKDWGEPEKWRKPEWRRPKLPPMTALPRSVVDWFKGRGIPESVLARNRIRCEEVYIPGADGHARAIGFPYYRAGELINVKWRDNAKNFAMEAGAERILYGLDDIDETDVLVWVEGEVDKLSLEAAGFTKVVSVPDGAPSVGSKSYASKFAFMETAEEKLAKVPLHILAVDSDEPGKWLEDELARRLGREKCRRVRWPAGCKDANEVLMRDGRESVAALVASAEPYPLEGVFEVADRAANVRSLHEKGFERGHQTGWKAVDRLYTVRPGEFTVVTGIPSSGKSNWLDCLLVNLAELHGWTFGIFSPENLPLEQHMAALIEKRVRKPFHRGPTERMTERELDEGLRWANDHFSWILPPQEDNWTIENVLELARQVCFRKGIRGLVVDPWNELEANRPAGMTETEYVSSALKRARVFARERGIHVWIVVHPAKLLRDKAGEYPVPTLYDCSGSAHWRNKADNGLCVWRDLRGEDQPTVQIHVQKVRFRQIGMRGMAELYYERACATYSDLPASIDPAEERYR